MTRPSQGRAVPRQHRQLRLGTGFYRLSAQNAKKKKYKKRTDRYNPAAPGDPNFGAPPPPKTKDFSDLRHDVLMCFGLICLNNSQFLIASLKGITPNVVHSDLLFVCTVHILLRQHLRMFGFCPCLNFSTIFNYFSTNLCRFRVFRTLLHIPH